MALRYENLLTEPDHRIRREYDNICAPATGYENNGSIGYLQNEISQIRIGACWAGGIDTLTNQITQLDEQITALEDSGINRADIDMRSLWDQLGLEEIYPGQQQETLALLERMGKDKRQEFIQGPSEAEFLDAITQKEAEFRGEDAPPFQTPAEVFKYYEEQFNELFDARNDLRAEHAAGLDALREAAEIPAADLQTIENWEASLSQHLSEIATTMGLVMDRSDTYHHYESIPESLRTRIDGQQIGGPSPDASPLFSGALEPLREWNETNANNGHFAHYFGYAMQDFRNSPAAGQISALYDRYHAEGDPGKQLLLEDKMRELVQEAIPEEFRDILDPDVVFKTIFETPLKPDLFSPTRNPNYFYEAEIDQYSNSDIPFETVRDITGNAVFVGKDVSGKFDINPDTGEMKAEGPWLDIEGNMGHIIIPLQSFDQLQNDTESSVLSINYYINQQPNFRFFFENGAEEYFKTYLGGKGQFLWHNWRSEDNPELGGVVTGSTEAPLNSEQLATLNEFFRWENEHMPDSAAPQVAPTITNDPVITPFQ